MGDKERAPRVNKGSLKVGEKGTIINGEDGDKAGTHTLATIKKSAIWNQIIITSLAEKNANGTPLEGDPVHINGDL